jgi:CRISPR-associated protein Csy2
MWLAVTLSVQKASAKNAYCVYGHPSPFAFIGFAHALCLKAQVKQKGGVLAVFHDIEMHATPNAFHEYGFDLVRSAQRDAKETKGGKGRTQLDTPMANLEVSICFEIQSANYDGLKTRLKDILETMRFAGGVVAASEFRVAETADEAFRIKAGFAMCAATLERSAENVFRRLLDKISIQRGKKGWFTASLVGFRLIEDPAEDRSGVRGGYPHAYADPMIGVVEFKSVRKATVRDMWTIERSDRLIKFVTENQIALRELTTTEVGV